MKLFALFGAGALAVATLAGAAPADAQHYGRGYHHGYGHYHRGYHRFYAPRWHGGRHWYGHRGYYRHHRW